MTSTALLPYPRRFQGGTSGWVWPAASVARARRVWRPALSAPPAHDPARAGAGGVAADVVGRPVERPVLLVVRAGGRLEPGRVPVALAGEADVDPGHGTRPGPGLAAHRVRSPIDDRAVGGSGDPRAHAHQGDRLV